MGIGVRVHNLCTTHRFRPSLMVLVRLPLVNIQKMVGPYCSMSKRCTIIPHRSRRNSTFKQETSSPSLQLPRMAGGVASCWTKREGNPGDTFSRAILFACFSFPLRVLHLHFACQTRAIVSCPTVCTLCPRLLRFSPLLAFCLVYLGFNTQFNLFPLVSFPYDFLRILYAAQEQV